MKFKILGSGASMGVPMIGCKCAVCTSSDPRNIRSRCSVLIESDQGYQILIDTSPDLRQQILANQIETIDAVYITHCHFDHVEGLNELRPLNFKSGKPIKLFIHEDHKESLITRFDYIFEPNIDYPGAPAVIFEIHTFKSYESLEIFDLKIQTLWADHGNINVAGIICNQIAYIPDCSGFSVQDREFLDGIEHLIIDGMWPEVITRNHFNIEQAIAFGKEIKAKKTYLTHLSHRVDYLERAKYETENIKLCYDGLLLNV